MNADLFGAPRSRAPPGPEYKPPRRESQSAAAAASATKTEMAMKTGQFVMQCITVVFQLAFVGFIVMILINTERIIRAVTEATNLMVTINAADMPGMLTNAQVTLTNVATLSGNATHTIGLVDKTLQTVLVLTPSEIEYLLANVQTVLVKAANMNVTQVLNTLEGVLTNVRSISGNIMERREVLLKF